MLAVGEVVYRSMKPGPGGLPLPGPSARELGVRPGKDIPVRPTGLVSPETGGMSVSPGSPTNLPLHRRPPAFGGTGKDPVFAIDADDLGAHGLHYRPDPENPVRHGFVEPSREMSLEEYQGAIRSTAASWRRVQ
jgi:hypothetical protein